MDSLDIAPPADALDAVAAPAAAGWRTLAADLLELTKPRIALMVALTAATGLVMATAGGIGALDLALLVHTVVGTALVAAGAGALNQVVERDVDARMRRTANRPIPSGRVDPDVGLLWGVLLAVVGIAWLAAAVNLLTAMLAGLTLAGYVFVYTPMKRLSSLSTLVGAVPGAVPPMMGWTAARYTAEMGGSMELIEIALRVPPWEPMYRLVAKELRRMKITTVDYLFEQDAPAAAVTVAAQGASSTSAQGQR
jgi:protoheme IX farnesyltransferase